MQWFQQEVHAHDAQLKAYLRNSFPAVRDVEDVVQESYLRIWKAKAREPIRTAKAFLFKVARHLALDDVRRGRISPFEEVAEIGGIPAAHDAPSAPELLSSAEKFQLLAEAIAELPPACRSAMLLCKVKGVTHREAARQLGISERTVDEQIHRGIKRLGHLLRERGLDNHF